MGIVLHPGLQLLKIGASAGLANLGDTLDAVFHPPGSLQHLPSGATAAVAVAIADQNIVVDLLILVAFPTAHNGVGVENAIVGGKEILLGILAHVQGGNEVGQHLGAIDAPPNKGVIGDFIDLIPGQLGGHKVIHAALLHNLGQSAGIAKHIRQPQDPVVLTKFLPEEPFAVNELTHQGLAGGQIAVRLQPHAALRLPPAFLHPLLNLGVQLGIALLQEVIQHRLAGHKPILRVLIHELQDRGKGANHLLPGLGHSPPPSHINVGMADAGSNHIGMPPHFFIQVLCQICPGLLHRGVKRRGAGGPHVQQVHSMVQHRLNIQPGLIIGVHPAESPQRHLQIVIQVVNGFIQHIQIHQEVELPVQRTGVGLNIHRQGLPHRRLGEELDVPVVHIRALGHLAIHKDQELGILAIVPLFNLGPDLHPHRFTSHLLRNGDISPEPVVLALDALKVALIALKLTLEIVAAVVDGIPMHPLAVKILPRLAVLLRLLRAEEQAPLILPVGQLPAVPNPQRLQLVTNDLNSFVDKIHCNPPRRKFQLRRRAALSRAYRLFSFT